MLFRYAVLALVLAAAARNPEADPGAMQPEASPERPLKIEGASGSVVRSVVFGPVFQPPEHFQGIEDYHNARVKSLREEYRLDRVVAGEASEFQRMLKLRHWVHTRWPIDNDQNFGGDAFAILEKAKTGAGFHCTHSMIVQHAAMVSMGYVARDLGVDRNHEDLGRSVHHGVNEVWSNQYAKWILLDAKYDIHFERDGVPLSALELHESVRTDGGRGVVKKRGIDRREVSMEEPDAPEGSVRGYWWISYYLRPNPFTAQYWNGSSALLIPDNSAFRETVWYRGGDQGLVKHWAYAAGGFIRARGRSEIEWTPGVPDLRVRQVDTTTLEVQIRSATPNLKSYMVRTNGGPWRSLQGDRERWTLRGGENRLQTRTINLFGVEGPVVSALVRFSQAGLTGVESGERPASPDHASPPLPPSP